MLSEEREIDRARLSRAQHAHRERLCIPTRYVSYTEGWIARLGGVCLRAILCVRFCHSMSLQAGIVGVHIDVVLSKYMDSGSCYNNTVEHNVLIVFMTLSYNLIKIETVHCIRHTLETSSVYHCKQELIHIAVVLIYRSLCLTGIHML